MQMGDHRHDIVDLLFRPARQIGGMAASNSPTAACCFGHAGREAFRSAYM